MYFAKKKKKGFTLIELLVVIAIIGILATIVVVNVNDARNKAYDVAIKSAVEGVRSVAELIYDSAPASYSGLCNGGVLNTAHATYGTQLTAASTSLSVNGVATVHCYANATSYCVEANLKSNTANYFCVDSNGVVKNYTGSSDCASGDIDCD
jgi:prepilin-type N-terminal cleavage/methylation domain-containing protein